MTKPVRCIDARRAQRGEALLEALIGILLLAILGLGLAYAAARTLSSQRYAATHGIVLAQMRNALETQGVQALCDGSQTAEIEVIPTGGSTVRVTLPAPECHSDAVSAAVAGDPDFPATALTGAAVTRMGFSTPDEDDARDLLGPGSFTLSQ